MYINRFLVVCTICVGLFFAVDTHISYACSPGPALTVAGLVDQSDYLIKAHMIEQDEAEQNIIIQVESYLLGGSGPEFLLMNRNPPTSVRYALDGYSSGADCSRLDRPLAYTESFYVFLERTLDGSYSIVWTLNNPSIYLFESSDDTEYVYLEGRLTESGEIDPFYANRFDRYGTEVTESEFLGHITNESEITNQTPDTSYRYPLKSPLLIHTQTESYVLPIDWQQPVLATEVEELYSHYYPYSSGFSSRNCSRSGCEYISDNGFSKIWISKSGMISSGFGMNDSVDGQHLLFAPTSDAIVVWNDCDIDIYITGSPRIDIDWYDLRFVTTITLKSENCESYHGQAAWTPDGRQLAYSDDEGLWLWDVYTTNSQPELLISNESGGHPIPNHFSPLGRYLNFSNGGVNKHLDLVSGELLDDGLISPDDKILINFDRRSDQYGYLVCILILHECQHGEGLQRTNDDEQITSREQIPTPVLLKTEWIDNSTFFQVACTQDEPDVCTIIKWHPHSRWGGWNNSQYSHGIDFAYNFSEDIIAILKDLHTLSIDGVTIDMTQWLDDDIISIEWLPSLFYYHD